MNLIRKSTHSQILNSDAIVQPYYLKGLNYEHNWPIFLLLIRVQEANVENQTATWTQTKQGEIRRMRCCCFFFLWNKKGDVLKNPGRLFPYSESE